MEAEKKLISLQVKVETLKEKYNVEKQQNHKYKVQEYGYDKCNNNLSLINPIALRQAKTLWSFGLCECKRVMRGYEVMKGMIHLL